MTAHKYRHRPMDPMFMWIVFSLVETCLRFNKLNMYFCLLNPNYLVDCVTCMDVVLLSPTRRKSED